MEEEQAAEAADAFLKAAGRTMDVSFESCVTLPGDDLTARVSKGSSSIKLGPGLRQMGGQVIATKSGALRYKAPKTYWIESNQRRYVPRVEDHVVGIVEDRMGEYYRVNIFGSSTALLPILAFDGATKRNKPNLKPGALVYSRMAVADKHMDPELSCEAAGHASRKDWMTGLSTFGELKGGTMARCSLMHARSLIKPGSLVLNELGGSIPFEIAIGANGVFWVNSASPEHTVAIVGAVKCSETMDGAQTKSMVREIINDIRK